MKDKSGEVEQEEYYLETWPSNTQNYLKAFQVRHPLERLLSSYRFVFERQQMRHTAQDLCKHIFYTYAKPENSSLEEYPGSDFLPTFRQFLQYVVDSGEDFDESKYVVVSHWKPYWLSCNPCHPDFTPDFILHMESIDEDTLCFLGNSARGIQGEDLKNLRHVNISPMGHSSGRDIQAKYFSTLDETLLKRVQNKYWPDFLLYGYDLRPFLKMTKLNTE